MFLSSKVQNRRENPSVSKETLKFSTFLWVILHQPWVQQAVVKRVRWRRWTLYKSLHSREGYILGWFRWKLAQKQFLCKIICVLCYIISIESVCMDQVLFPTPFWNTRITVSWVSLQVCTDAIPSVLALVNFKRLTLRQLLLLLRQGDQQDIPALPDTCTEDVS